MRELLFFKKALKEHLNKIAQRLLADAVVEKANFGLNDHSSGFYGYISFYPQEIDLIISIEEAQDPFRISIELMTQEGRDPEELWHFSGNLADGTETMKAGLDDLLRLTTARLHRERCSPRRSDSSASKPRHTPATPGFR